MGRLFIDLTDVAHHANWNATITGIQRVQLQIAVAIVTRSGACAFSIFKGEYCNLTTTVARHAHPDSLFIALRRRFGCPVSRNLPLRGLKDRLANLLFATRRMRRFTGLGRSPTGVCFGSDDIIYIGGAFWAEPRSLVLYERAAARGVRLIAFIHDLIPLSCPQFTDGGARPFFQRMFALPLHVIANSEFTRSEVQQTAERTAGARISAVEVVRLAHEFPGSPRNGGPGAATPRLANLLAGSPFVLTVGTVEIRKNHLWLMEAWQKMRAAYDGLPKLVIAGRRGWMAPEALRRLTEARPDSCFVFVEAPTDNELRWLYASALFTVFPSLAEGWGLPVGESLWFGTPCIATNITAIPEVGGDLCLYVAPRDTDALISAILDLWQNSALRDRHRTQIARAPLRTWNMVERELLAAVERIRSLPASTAPLKKKAREHRPCTPMPQRHHEKSYKHD